MRTPTRVVLVHDDHTFLNMLATSLRELGDEVETTTDPAFKVAPPHATDKLEITVSRSTGRYPGVRIRVSGFPATQPYSGPLGQFLADPVQASDVLNALNSFRMGSTPKS